MRFVIPINVVTRCDFLRLLSHIRFVPIDLLWPFVYLRFRLFPPRANEYQTRAMSTRLPSCENATYMLFGLMAEVGEIADKIAKWRRKGVCRLDMDHLVFNTGDLQEVEGYKSELMKEVGDCAWFIAGIADCFGFTLEEVMQQNLDKLASRRERGVIDGNGDNR